MKCYFSSYCKAPKNLCCNFCSNKECDSRCKIDHKTCGLFDNDVINESDKLILKTPTTDTTPIKEFYLIINKKSKLKLYKKYSTYYQLKEEDSSGYELVKTTKNRAQKKVDELNKELGKKYWSIELI